MEAGGMARVIVAVTAFNGYDDRRLTEHFHLAEFIESDYATRHGINNTPSLRALGNLVRVANGLERIRSVLGVPIFITSGYRCPELNSAIGGAATSQHLDGLACDFKAPAYGTPREVCAAIADNRALVGFDQLIQEGNWTHVSFSERGRGEILTAHFLNGRATYTKGLA